MKHFLCDETPWGQNTKWEREYIAESVDAFDAGFQEGLFLTECIPSLGDSALALDLGCGVGRHACAFASKGFETYAIDISKPALQKAAHFAIIKNVPISFLHEDFTQLVYSENFSLITILNDTFGRLSEQDNIVLIRDCFRALVPGGFLVISGDNREQIVEKLSFKLESAKYWTEDENGIPESRFSYFDVFTGRANYGREYIEAGEKRMDPVTSVRLYSYTELQSVLNACGFELLSAFGDYEGGKYTLISDKMIVIAQKNQG